MKVVLYQTHLVRSQVVVRALAAGFKAADPYVKVEVKPHTVYTEPGDEQFAIFYGLIPPLDRAIKEYKAQGKSAVLWDLGFWRRKYPEPGGNFLGYHRFAVNELHTPPPMSLSFGDRELGQKRLASWKVRVVPEREHPPARHILLCGQSEKAARIYGLRPQQFEERAVHLLLSADPSAEIIYYPKLSWNGARPIAGTHFWRGYDHDELETTKEFLTARCIVTHHSNTAIRALAAGLPIVTVDGAARNMAYRNVKDALTAAVPLSWATRQTFLEALALMQWNIAEIESGAWWKFFRSGGWIA